MAPVVLVFDASGDQLWAGLASASGAVLVHKTAKWDGGKDRATKMLSLIQSVRGTKKLAGIATVVGPATPGGIRHNVTLANALGWALAVKVCPLLSTSSKKVAFGPWIQAGNLRPNYIHSPNITVRKK
jgi:predicted NBD/HSP70 family sugar kinase